MSDESVWEYLKECASRLDADGFMRTASRHLNEEVRVRNPAGMREIMESTAFLEARNISHEDPYTRRGYLKPRGYAGDAVLLDYVYGTAAIDEETSAFGREILAWCQQQSQAFAAVNDRKLMLAAEFAALSDRPSNMRCLAVACGHLRELALSGLPACTEIVALDQDPQSLAIVHATYGGRIGTVREEVSNLIRNGAAQLGSFDLITVAGLYDYLPEPYAIALTNRLAERLNVGGKLFVANFIDCWERGYMECFMEWKLIYRTLDAIAGFAAHLPPSFEQKTHADRHGVIGYLEIVRMC